MSEFIMLIHNGFEEVEALTTVDLLRRSGNGVVICSMTGNKLLKGSHNINIIADCLFEELKTDSFDGIILPGGMPNSHTLRNDERVIETVRKFCEAGRLVCAICAAPCVLERAGLLKGKRATSYPGCIDAESCIYSEEPALRDGNIITSRGVGTAIPFALEIIKYVNGEGAAKRIAESIIYK